MDRKLYLNERGYIQTLLDKEIEAEKKYWKALFDNEFSKEYRKKNT